MQAAAQGARGSAATVAGSSQSSSSSHRRTQGERRGARSAPRTGRAILSGARCELRRGAGTARYGATAGTSGPAGTPLETRLRAGAWPPAQVLYAAATPALSGPPVPGLLRSARRGPRSPRPSGPTRPYSMRTPQIRARGVLPVLRVLLRAPDRLLSSRARQVPRPLQGRRSASQPLSLNSAPLGIFLAAPNA